MEAGGPSRAKGFGVPEGIIQKHLRQAGAWGLEGPGHGETDNHQESKSQGEGILATQEICLTAKQSVLNSGAALRDTREAEHVLLTH